MIRSTLILLLLLCAYVAPAQIVRDTVFTVPIYDIEVRIAVVESLTGLFDDVSENAHAVTFVNRHGQICMAFQQDRLTVEVIFHEVQHSVNFLCLERGLEHDADNDESQAYLSGYLGERVVKYVKPR